MAVGYLGILFIGANPFMVYVLIAFMGLVGQRRLVYLAIMTQKVGNSKIGLLVGLFNLSVVYHNWLPASVLVMPLVLLQIKFNFHDLCLYTSNFFSSLVYHSR